MQCHKGCRLEHPLWAMSLVSWGVERLTRFSLSLYLFRVIWLNVYKVLLCLHCWGITTIRCPSMLAYGLANNNLVCILCSEDGLLFDWNPSSLRCDTWTSRGACVFHVKWPWAARLGQTLYYHIIRSDVNNMCIHFRGY